MIRKALFFSAVLATSVAAILACSSSGSGGGTPWAGTYSCMTMQTVTLTQPAGQMPMTTNSNGSLTVTQSGNKLTAVTDSEGGQTCQILLTANGNSATFNPGQTCAVNSTTMGATVTATISLTMGSATLNGSSLSASFGGTISGTAMVGTSSIPIMGNVSETATCTKM